MKDKIFFIYKTGKFRNEFTCGYFTHTLLRNFCCNLIDRGRGHDKNPVIDFTLKVRIANPC